MTHPESAVPSFSWSEVCARRLARHGLAAPVDPGQLAELTGVMCGVHAQVMSAAELSISLRVNGLTRAGVRAALWEEHSIIKTYGPRGTVHLLSAHDLSMWMGALGAVAALRNLNAKDRLMTPEQTEWVILGIAKVLEDAELTVDELTEALVAEVGSWAGDPVMEAFQVKWPRWREAMSEAAYRGAFCFGPNRGNKVTYTNPRRWLPDFQPEDSTIALATFLKRYLYAYGPATPQQFAKWLSAPRGWASDLFASLGNDLQRVELDGDEAWIVAGDTAMPDEPPSGLRLLPYFDAYVVGCHPREKLFPGRASDRALAAGQAGNFPVLLIDGVVAGVWHQRRSGRKIAITVEPLKELTSVQRRSLDEQVERIGEILEGTPTLTIDTITVGPHA